MRRTTFALACAAVSVAAVGVGVLTSGSARAAAPRDQGWWTVTNPVPAPDVPARGLLVQGGGGGAPTAFAAVLYELDPGTTAGTLTLAIAGSTVTTPTVTLQICGLLQPIVHPDQGGPMSNAPPYDCSRQATATPEGNAYKFDASSLVADRVLAVAILPTGPVDRVVLNPPDDSSLAVQQGSADAAAPLNDTSTGAPTDAATAPAGDLSTSTAPVGGEPSAAAVNLPGVSGDASSSVAPTPASVPPARAGASGAAGGIFLPAASTAPEKATPLLVILLVLGALSAGALWLYSGRQPRATLV